MEKAIPDVAALYLEEAIEVINSSGFTVKKITKTLPPRIKDDGNIGKLRVVSASHSDCSDDRGITLIVTQAADTEEVFRLIPNERI